MTHLADQTRRQAERIAFWGGAYRASTEESIRRAHAFECQDDYFTAYLYLFVAFNNLYCLLARFEGREPEKIRSAVKRISDSKVSFIYTVEYVHRLKQLNDGPPQQLLEGPDAGQTGEGINIRDYFLGMPTANCLAHVQPIAESNASVAECRSTLAEVAATLLYTIRNNQFHAVKGAQSFADLFTLDRAYKLLAPIVDALVPIARREVGRMEKQVQVDD